MIEISEDLRLFAGLTAEELNHVSACCTMQALAEGQVLFGAGDEARCAYVVCAGGVELHFDVVCYGAPVKFSLDHKSSGDLLGWSALLPSNRYTLTARATEPSELLRIDRDELLRCCEQFPRVGHVVMRNLAGIVGERYELVSRRLEREIQNSLSVKDPLA